MAHPLTQLKNFSYQTLEKQLGLSDDEKNRTEALLKAYEDDFWQDGKGSLLPPPTGTQASLLKAHFKERHIFRNIIRECAERVSRAFFGKTPNWKISVSGKEADDAAKPPAPTDGSTTTPENEAIDRALSDFWSQQKVAEAMSQALESRLTFGRGGLRVFIPLKFKRQNLVEKSTAGSLPALDNETPIEELEAKDYVQFPDIVEAIKAMRVEFVNPRDSKFLDDWGDYFSIVRYEVIEDWNTARNIKVIEFSFVDDNDFTWVGVVKENEGVESILDSKLSSGFDLDGWPTFNEFKGKPYVTKGMYKNNQMANLALTCGAFNLIDNGFQELILTNVKLQTKTVEDPTDPTKTIEVPLNKLARGGGAVQNFVGIEDQDEATGGTRTMQPGVHYNQPPSMDAFTNGYDLAYDATLQEAGQMYVKISGDATASGESRVQALGDFILKIGKYQGEVDQMGSWLLTTVLRWAAALSGQEAKFSETKVVFASRIFVGQLSDAEKQVVITMQDKGLISKETARILLGSDDPSLENNQVLGEQALPPEEQTMDDLSAKLNVALLMEGIFSKQYILKFLGLKPAEIQKEIDQSAQNQLDQLTAFQNAGDLTGGNNPPPDQGGGNNPPPQPSPGPQPPTPPPPKAGGATGGA